MWDVRGKAGKGARQILKLACSRIKEFDTLVAQAEHYEGVMECKLDDLKAGVEAAKAELKKSISGDSKADDLDDLL